MLVRNDGKRPVDVTGIIRAYTAGRLFWSGACRVAGLQPGQTTQALSDTYLTFTIAGPYLFQADIDAPPAKQVHLNPTTVTASGTAPTPPAPVSAHAVTHELGGSDQIALTGLAGKLATPQTPEAHAHTHAPGASDPIAGVPPTQHHLTHEPGGSDVITGIGYQSHHTKHEHTGTDELSIAGLAGVPAAAGAASGLATLNASTLVPPEQLGTGGSSPATEFLRHDQTWAPPAGQIAQPARIWEPTGYNDGLEHQAVVFNLGDGFLQWDTELDLNLDVNLAPSINPCTLIVKLWHVQNSNPGMPILQAATTLLLAPLAQATDECLHVTSRLYVQQPGAPASCKTSGYAMVRDTVGTKVGALNAFTNLNTPGPGQLYYTVQLFDSLVGILWEQRLGTLTIIRPGTATP